MSFRIGATVLIDHTGNAIQSYSFKTRRILGCISKVLKFLDGYKVDEIHLIVPLKQNRPADMSEIFLKLADIPVSTPLALGGGINVTNLAQISKDPFFERLIFNSAIYDDLDTVQRANLIMGRQSILACIPFSVRNGELIIYHAREDCFKEVPRGFWEKLDSMVNEVILVDAYSEGSKTGFDFEVLKFINFPHDRILISGGLTKNDIYRARNMGLAGVSVDNFALHSELSIGFLR